jgi:hypothetical protein
MNNKPPIGIEPKFVWDARRHLGLGDAIVRYIDDSLPVPIEWVEEYNELCKTRSSMSLGNGGLAG